MKISQTQKQKDLIYNEESYGRCHYATEIKGIKVLKDCDGYGRGCTVIFSCPYVVDGQEKILSLESRYSEGESVEAFAHLLEIGASGEFSTLSRELDRFGNHVDDEKKFEAIMAMK